MEEPMKFVNRISSLVNGALLGSVCIAQDQPGVPGRGALHLLSAAVSKGSATYEATLYRLNTARNGLSKVRDMGIKKEGVDFILSDFPGRHLVVASPCFTPSRLYIIDMNSAASVRLVPFDLRQFLSAAWKPWPPRVLAMGGRVSSDHISIVSHVMIDRPGFGRWLAVRLASGRGTLEVGIQLVAPAKWEVLDSGIMTRVRVQGTFGIGYYLGDTDQQSPQVIGSEFFLGDLDLGIPTPDVDTKRNDTWWLAAYDGRLAVMQRAQDPSATKDGDGSSPLWVWDSRSERWSSYRVPGYSPRVKMIGSWIMGTAVTPAHGRESPGRSHRRRAPSIPGQLRPIPMDRPPTDAIYKDFGGYFPGLLFLVNTETRQQIEIRTNEGDSEILLLYEGSVYYRVNNQLFEAPLKDSGIGPARLLAEDDAIPDVHWAFMGS
jgi:hypothetical protein